MTAPIPIAVDAMSGDHGAATAVAACKLFLEKNTRDHLVITGDFECLTAEISRQFGKNNSLTSRISIVGTTEIVAMDESPSKVLRNKKDSSMRVAIDLIKQGKASACVSAGNTGALMATAKFVLKTLPGVDRPAILSAIPSARGHTLMLDLGANAECSAEQLVQFAVMGSVVASAGYGVENPKIGLLNIGEEEIKGIESVKRAASMLNESALNYIGFIEGDDIFHGDQDVVVCDGFIGNVALKTSEGLAKLIKEFMRQEFTRNSLTKLAALVARPVLMALGQRMDPRNYNGASFVGLRHVVVKSHGGADAFAFAAAIQVAKKEVEKDVPNRISNQLELILQSLEKTSVTP